MLLYRSSISLAPPLWLGVRQPARRYASAAKPPSGQPAEERSGAQPRAERRRARRQHPQRPERSVHSRQSKASPGASPASRSSRRRLLAAAAGRIENTPEYLGSLAALQRLVTSFRKELNEAQNRRWLAVEEALLEHAARVNEAYFWEGTAAGGRESPRADSRP